MSQVNVKLDAELLAAAKAEAARRRQTVSGLIRSFLLPFLPQNIGNPITESRCHGSDIDGSGTPNGPEPVAVAPAGVSGPGSAPEAGRDGSDPSCGRPEVGN